MLLAILLQPTALGRRCPLHLLRLLPLPVVVATVRLVIGGVVVFVGGVGGVLAGAWNMF